MLYLSGSMDNTSRWTIYEEKETDVSLAVSLLEDAAMDRYDVALLFSADSDLCPAVRAVRRVRPSFQRRSWRQAELS
jgi:uncharacterized LabA/DUF88 family protein